MDQSTKEIQKYIDNLVPVVKTAVLSPEWRKRVGEIGVKYSLHLDQISSLEYEVLFVMIGMEPEEDLVENIEKELNISKILATQIAEEVNVRVFQYILKLMQEKTVNKQEKFVDSNHEVRSTNNEVDAKTQNRDSNIVIRNSTPLLSEMETMAGGLNNELQSTNNEEKETNTTRQGNQPRDSYIVHRNSTKGEPPANLPGVVEEENGSTNNEVRITNRTETVIPNPVVIRDSYIVPPSNFADTKLNTTVTSAQQTVVKEESPIVKNYAADPYREPLE